MARNAAVVVAIVLVTLLQSNGALAQVDWTTQVTGKPFIDVNQYAGSCSSLTCPSPFNSVTPSADWKKIQCAVNAAAAGQQVVIPEGTYSINCPIAVSTSVTIDGPGTIQLTASGSTPPGDLFAFNVTADNVVIDRLNITNPSDLGYTSASNCNGGPGSTALVGGVQIEASHVVVRNSSFDNLHSGISDGSFGDPSKQHTEVINNRVTNLKGIPSECGPDAISVFHRDSKVVGNYVTLKSGFEARAAIVSDYDSRGVMVIGNTVLSDNGTGRFRRGIHIESPQGLRHAIVSKNRLEGNFGVPTNSWGGIFVYNSSVTITDNTLVLNANSTTSGSASGIYVGNSNASTIANNIIEISSAGGSPLPSLESGVQVYNSPDSSVQGNLIRQAVTDTTANVTLQYGIIVQSASGTVVGGNNIERSTCTYFDLIDGNSGGWTSPTLANGWSNVGGGYFPLGYMKDANGIVHLRGTAGGGTQAADFLSVLLPVGYRPSASSRFIASGYNGSTFVATRVIVDGAGDIYPPDLGGSTVSISLDGITFDTH